jgi:hypothetical protein
LDIVSASAGVVLLDKELNPSLASRCPLLFHATNMDLNHIKFIIAFIVRFIRVSNASLGV